MLGGYLANALLLCNYTGSVMLRMLRVLSSDGSASSKLLIFKKHVAPLKSLSIPRLEPCAAVLLANLLHKINTAMDMNFIDTWVRLTVALAWLKSPPSKYS